MSKSDFPIKYPNGYRGIGLVDTNEAQQEELFHPTDTILIAVNYAGDTEMGSAVVDLDKDNNMDGDRAARLQSLFRVIKYPFGEKHCALGLQLGPSGQKDTRGYFVDRLTQDKVGSSGGYPPVYTPSGSVPTDPKNAGKIAIAQGSYMEGGPFHCGTGNCKHVRGKDDDGNPISSLHIYYQALFRKDDSMDGPLKFEGSIAPPNQNTDFRVDCHLSWDPGAQKWYWWTTNPFYPVPDDPLLPLQPPPNYPMVPITPLTGIPLVPSQGDKPGKPGNPPPPYPGFPGVPSVDVPWSGPAPPPVIFPTPAQADITGTIANSSLTGDGMRVVAASAAVQMSAVVAQAVNYTNGALDSGLFSQVTSQGAQKGSNAPASMVSSAFAAQGGTTPASGGYSPSQTGASGDPWNYTQSPRRQRIPGKKPSKFRGGTANGGIIYHPPETDLRDAKNLAMQPPNTTLSTSYVLTAPNAYFGSGVPNLATGSLKDGYSWGVDASTGDLVYRSHSDSQSPFEAVRFTKTSQNIRWMSQQTFYGEFEHANTGNRVYTFPDATGTVGVLTAGSADGSGSSVSTGKAGGSGPASTALARWLTIIGDDGLAYRVEGYR